MVQLDESPPEGGTRMPHFDQCQPQDVETLENYSELQETIQKNLNALQEQIKETMDMKGLTGLTSLESLRRLTKDNHSDVSTSSASPNNTTTDEELSDIGSGSSLDGRRNEGSLSPSSHVLPDSPEMSHFVVGLLPPGLPPGTSRPVHEKRHQCDICGKGFPYLSILESHKRCHTGEKPFKCHFCDKKFAQKATLQVHERTHTGERPYKCRYCEKTFAQYGTKTVHEKSAHLGIRNYKCPKCDKCLSSPSALYTHKKTHGEKTFQCEFCSKTFALKNYLKLHVKQVHEQNDKKHVCKFCHKSFAYAGSLQVHIRTHTGERPYVCKYCPKAFASQGNLQSHERTHTGERPYSCTKCGRSFIQKSQLTAHEATHSSSAGSESGGPSSPEDVTKKTTTGGDYACKFCGKRYTHASSLYVHIRVHTGQRPYRCNHCDKSFTNQGNLQVHQRTHTGEKPYKCNACDKSYAQKVGLKIHLVQCQPHLVNRGESESPINVETDSDCGSDSSTSIQKAAIDNLFIKNIYNLSPPQNVCPMPFNLPQSLPTSLPQRESNIIKMPHLHSALGGFVAPQLPMRAPEMPPPDFGPMTASKPPFQPEMSMPESMSAFHTPSSLTAQGSDVRTPTIAMPQLAQLQPQTTLANHIDSSLLALKGLLDANSLPMPSMPSMPPLSLSTQLLNTHLLLQMQQNQADQIASLLGGQNPMLGQFPNLFNNPLFSQLPPLPAPQPTYAQPVKPEAIKPIHSDVMLA